MVWIKRNLMLVVSGGVGLALTGLGVFLVLGGLNRNKELGEEVENARSTASKLYDTIPFPSKENIAAAKQELASLHAAISKARQHLGPVPLERMDAKQFMVWRDETLKKLRDAAKEAGTELPVGHYAFSFETQRGKNQFSPDTIPHVPEQMADVKELCMILFQARVNKIGNIRRAKMSTDDKQAAFATDYMIPGGPEVTSDPTGQMVSYPYEVTFYSFTTEMADVLNRLDRSTNGFLVKAIQVEPEDSKGMEGGSPATPTQLPTGQAPERPTPIGRPPLRPPPAVNRPPAPPPTARPLAGDRPVYLLKEKRLKVTLLIYALRPAPAK